MNAIAHKNLDTPDVVGGLTASFILVDLTISEWVGRKLDKGNTRKIIADNGAKAKDAANVTKKLFVDNPKLEAIGKAVGAARTYVDSMTVPWMGKLKLLPMVRFIEFQDAMGTLEADFQKAVNDFITDYDVQISAMAFKLGALFDRSEYPAAGEIQGKFAMKWNYMPVPTAGDFRVEAENVLKQSLQDAYQNAMNARIEECMTTLWDRLKECLEHMVDRLGYKDDGKPNIFRDSLTENAKELVNLLGVMNIANDTKMESARQQLLHLLDGVEPDELRKNQHIRDDVRQNVADILENFNF